MNSLTDKVAIVTGASKGIGAGIARAFAAAGASVVVNYASSKEGADKVADEISKAGGRAVAIQADVSRRSEVERLFSETKKAFDRLDILVNNAGVFTFQSLEELREDEFHRQFNTNVLGLLLATREALKYFGEAGGSVINISSAASRLTPPNSAIYTGTKGAVDAITGALARELGPRKIRVNAINPGVVVTEGFHATELPAADFEQQMIAQTPLGRLGQPDDIADVALFLASDGARWLTGEKILAGGGLR